MHSNPCLGFQAYLYEFGGGDAPVALLGTVGRCEKPFVYFCPIKGQMDSFIVLT